MKENIGKKRGNNMCVWVEDADVLKEDSRELNIVYETRSIKSFLSTKNMIFGIAGIKGQGKTFILKVKQKRISEDDSIVCIPKGRMLDSLDSSSLNINQGLIGFLKDYNIWVNIWKCSIAIAVLSAINYDIESIAEENNIKLNKNIKYIFKNIGSRSQSTKVLSYLLTLTVDELKSALSNTAFLLDCISNIKHSVCVFIDKIDQTFSVYAKNINQDNHMPSRSRNASF